MTKSRRITWAIHKEKNKKNMQNVGRETQGNEPYETSK